MNELLPCPFCWSDDSDESVEVLEDKFGCYIVQCGCGASSSSELGTENAISAWNKRAVRWQPIETAPKDKYVDLWADGERLTDCCWVVDHWSNGSGFESSAVTHWMPIPDGPKEP